MKLLILFVWTLIPIYIFSDSAKDFFKNEVGVHRFQRIPPTESKGRTHTSTVVVTLLKLNTSTKIQLSKKDVNRETTVGSGPGGQHRNRTESCVVLTHKKTNLKVRIDGRNQHQNERLALDILSMKVASFYEDTANKKQNKRLNEQVKGIDRGYQRRTYNYKTGIVIDHKTNNKTTLKNILKGKINLLH